MEIETFQDTCLPPPVHNKASLQNCVERSKSGLCDFLNESQNAILGRALRHDFGVCFSMLPEFRDNFVEFLDAT